MLLTAIGTYRFKDDKYCRKPDYKGTLPTRMAATYKSHRVFATLEEAQKECKRKQLEYDIKRKYKVLMEQEIKGLGD